MDASATPPVSPRSPPSNLKPTRSEPQLLEPNDNYATSHSAKQSPPLTGFVKSINNVTSPVGNFLACFRDHAFILAVVLSCAVAAIGYFLQLPVYMIALAILAVIIGTYIIADITWVATLFVRISQAIAYLYNAVAPKSMQVS